MVLAGHRRLVASPVSARASNWWQRGYDPIGPSTQSAMVEACVSAYAQTVAMCPGDHWRLNDKGGRDRVKNSALSRILRHPNDYQSISDFMLNATRSLYLEGNAYALALRNDRFEIDELHLMDPMLSYPRLATTGDIFYQLYGNDVIEKRLGGEQLIVPQRDVLHIRLHTVRHRYPDAAGRRVAASSRPMATSASAAPSRAQQLKFYMNEARPSAVLSTDLMLDKDQVQALRDRWNEQAKGLHQGGTPILTAGLKVQPWSQGGKDAATAEMMKLSQRAHRAGVPHPAADSRHRRHHLFIDRAADAELDRVGPRLRAQPHRGSLRPAVRAEGPARRICRVRHGRRCCARR